MKIEKIRISYSTTIPIMSYGVNDKIGVEIEMSPQEIGELKRPEQFDLEKLIQEHKSNVDAIVKKLYPGMYITVNPEYEHLLKEKQQPSTHEERRIGDIENDIRSCKELWELLSYKLIVKQKPEFQKIYDEVYAKLSQK